jgi:hypothetical protein
MYKIRFILTGILFLLLTNCREKTPDEFQESLKSQWIRLAFQTVQKPVYQDIKAIAWWNENWEEATGEQVKLRIDSSSESLETFRQAVSDNFFISDLVFDNGKLIPPVYGIYFGAFPDFGGPEDGVVADSIFHFEQLAQKNISWAYFSNNWYQNIHFPLSAVQEIHQAGKTPFIRMMARTSLEQNVADPNYSLQNIIDGQFDNDLLQWFSQASATGFPMLIEFGTEVNGEWFPWNGLYNGGGVTTGYGDPALADGPERFVAAYRHIIDLSRQAGANNLTWFFHLDSYGQPEIAWNDFENYYPGDDYIDWIGVSVYGPLSQNDEFEWFEHKLNRVYERIKIMTDKPIAILETGIMEYVMPSGN